MFKTLDEALKKSDGVNLGKNLILVHENAPMKIFNVIKST